MNLSPLSCKRIDLIKPRPSQAERVRAITACINVVLHQPWDIAEVNEGRRFWINPIWRDEDWENVVAAFEGKGWVVREDKENGGVVKIWPSEDEAKRLRVMAG